MYSRAGGAATGRVIGDWSVTESRGGLGHGSAHVPGWFLLGAKPTALRWVPHGGAVGFTGPLNRWDT